MLPCDWNLLSYVKEPSVKDHIWYDSIYMKCREGKYTRKFETSPVGGPTCRKTPISLSALEKNPRPWDLFEGNPVGDDLVWNYGYCKGYLDEVIRVDPNLIWLVSLQKGKFSLSSHLSPYHFPSSPPFPCPHSFFPSFIFCWTSWKRETGRQKQDFSF